MAPIISCVIPVFNDRAHLPRAVKSALSQRPDVQVVLVDDCSTDGSRELTLELARDDHRVVALTLPTNRGQGYARNIGVGAAEAPYIAFLDSDDQHAPGWYDHAISWLQRDANLAALIGEIELMEIPSGLEIDASDPRRIAIANSTIWNIVMRKSVFFAVGGCPISATFRAKGGAEDVAFALALKRNFSTTKTSHIATKHYFKPNGQLAHFLRRTQVVGTRIEFKEMTEEERTGALERALAQFQVEAKAKVEELRGMLGKRQIDFRGMLAEKSLKMLRKISGG